MFSIPLLHSARRASAAAFFASALTAGAQNADPLVYTVGKVVQGPTQLYAYVLWQPGDPATTFGKRFAVYRKDGASNSPNPYLKLGEQQLQTAPTAIQSLLKLGGRFDFNASEVADRINTLYADSYNVPGTPASGPEPGIEEARKLSRLLDTAATDPKVLERIFFLGRAHPGVLLAMGHAFAIKVPPASVHTYEIRQLDGGGNDARVIGRVTLDAANPQQLAPTGRPYAVPYPARPDMHEVNVSPLDHLSVRLRWGIPDHLRRLFPHAFGFNVYRVKRPVAEVFNWHVVPPAPADMEAVVSSSAGMTSPDAKRINGVPIMLTALMTDAQAQDLVSDAETAFVADDNEPPDNPFVDGEQFYYFVAPRDIAGHPGPLSRGTLVTICDRLPPPVPKCEKVYNVYEAPDTSTAAGRAALAQLKGTQHFRIRIRQVPETPSKDAAAEYHLYRWTDHTQHLREGGNPAHNRIAVIPHVPGEQYVDYDDLGPGAPMLTLTDDSLAGKTFWYTVRSVDNTACADKNYSGHSGPCWAVLRDRAGPGRPTGRVIRCVAKPRATCEIVSPTRLADIGLSSSFPGFVVRGVRTTSFIASVDVQLQTLSGSVFRTVFSTTRYFSTANVKQIPVPIAIGNPENFSLRVRGRTKTGVLSPWAVCPLSAGVPPQGFANTYEATIFASARYEPIPGTGEGGDPHDVVGPNGGITGPDIEVTIPVGTSEIRIYRRVGPNGSFEMIHRVDGEDLPSPLPDDLNFTDTAPPTVPGVEVCYFAQAFDENGNSGPRVKLGCVRMRSGDLPTPLLETPDYLPALAGQGQTRVSWFCDPVGVERFEVWVASSNKADPGLSSDDLSPNKLDVLDGSTITEDTEGLSFSGYQTPTLAGGFGNGAAEFSIDVTHPVPQSLTFVVRAVGKGNYQNPPVDDEARPTGAFSNPETATWKITDGAPQAVVPWPALPVPDVGEVGLPVDSYLKGEGPFYAMPLPTGEDASAAIFMGLYKALTLGDGGIAPPFDSAKDPLDFFFQFRGQNIDPLNADTALESIIPFVVYRHQLPTPANPDAVPNLVQVSPLIDRIAFKDLGAERFIRDPFFEIKGINTITPPWYVPTAGTFNRTLAGTTIGNPGLSPPPYLSNCDSYLYWLDKLPVSKGARYQYLIVHFTERGEIDRVIPTNFVDQP